MEASMMLMGVNNMACDKSGYHATSILTNVVPSHIKLTETALPNMRGIQK
jgi:hypothetical protein